MKGSGLGISFPLIAGGGGEGVVYISSDRGPYRDET
jgi:hypothetical protein